ncbi:MAG: HD domain-containing protein, partial [Lachnospiraceae bacterium]|nr:HD domain-containing protein [Lachnospiraceae bacterium]
LERDRIFCKHGLQHCLDVARIGYILILEEGEPLDKELFYSAALLHDLGRVAQYEQEIPHHEAGKSLAALFLEKHGFSQAENDIICEAIGAHRHNAKLKRTPLAEYLHRADRLSRNCFMCSAKDRCNWREEEKNIRIDA